MSGIVGLWNLDGQPVDVAVLDRMSATIRHRALDGRDCHVDGPFGLTHEHGWTTDEEVGERQPLVSRTGIVLAMDGRLDNRDELLGVLGLGHEVSDASCVLGAYERWGDAFAERLNGEYATVIVEPERRRLRLVRDAIGIRPLYYFHDDRLFAFASEIKALLAHPAIPARPDDEGLADYLMLGARPVDRQEITCFAGISAVVPSHEVVVTLGRTAIRRYWDFNTTECIRLRSFEDYAAAFREHFARAVKRRIRGRRPVAVSVSGGLDSSSVFCEAETLRRAGVVHCSSMVGVSYTGASGTDADEVAFQKAIEHEYQVAIERFPIDGHVGLVNGTDDQVQAVEAPFLDYMWGVTCELHRRASASGARVLLSGHWGDQVLFSSAYLVDLFNRLSWRQIRRHTREYRRWIGTGEARELTRRFVLDVGRYHAPRALVPALKWLRRRLILDRQAKGWFSDSFLRRALRHAHRPATFDADFHSAHARSIYLEARSKYHVHCMEWNNKTAALYGLEFSFPFLDRDLVAFLMAVPGDIQNRDGVPRSLIREALRGVLPDAVRARTWKADFTDAVNRNVASDVHVITAALSADSLAVRRGYVDRERVGPALQRLAANLVQPECTASWDLADLYSLERWLQVFFPYSQEERAG